MLYMFYHSYAASYLDGQDISFYVLVGGANEACQIITVWCHLYVLGSTALLSHWNCSLTSARGTQWIP